MSTNTLPPTGRDTYEWLAWLANEPCLTDAIDTAVEADMHWQIIASAVGKWIAENRQDQLAERIAKDFLRIDEALAAMPGGAAR